MFQQGSRVVIHQLRPVVEKIIVLEHITLDGVIQGPGQTRRGYQRRLPVWWMDGAIFQSLPWNCPEKADEFAIQPVVGAHDL